MKKKLTKGFLIFATLPCLALISARILATELVLNYEYHKKNFPQDPYGFSLKEREKYGRMGLAYLFNKKKINYLGDLTFHNGQPLFTQRELSHMVDVKKLVSQLHIVGIPLILAYLLLTIYLALQKRRRDFLLQCVNLASKYSLGMLLFLALSIGLAFPAFFYIFHKILGFKGNSFSFYTSDTLIRLYPEKFWKDVFFFALMGIFAPCVMAFTLTHRYLRKYKN